MMKKKKIFIFYSILAFLLLIFSTTVLAATMDKNPPVIKSISLVGNGEYKIGDKVYLNLDANDDVSGINRIDISIQNISVDNEGDDIISTTDSIYDFNTKKPYFVIPAINSSGTYTIDQIYIYDNSGNVRQYSNRPDLLTNNNFTELKYDIKFHVDATGSDKNAPVLKNIKFNSTNIKYGETLKITVDATDDLSGIRDIKVGLKTASVKDDISLFLQYDEKSGRYLGEFKPYINGKYNLSYVTLNDNSLNQSFYYTDSFESDNAIREPDNRIDAISFNVTGAKDTYSKITIKSIDYKYAQLTAPSVFQLKMKLDDKDAIVRRVVVYIGLKGEDKSASTYLEKDDNGYFSGFFDINQFFKNGKYEVKEIFIETNLDDDLSFSREVSSKLKYSKETLFEVVDSDDFDVVTSTTDKELLTKIKNCNDNSKIAINSAGDTIIKKEVFESIKGTNKTINIESDGIVWVFEGKNITNPKDIDVDTVVDFYYNSDSAEELGNYIKKGLSIKFKDNGALPGVVKIRLKADYAFRNYIGIEGLYVYQYNVTTNKKGEILFTKVAKEVKMSEDGYYDFYLIHNSEYIVSSDEIDKKVSEEKIITKDTTIQGNDLSKEKNINTNKNAIICIISGCLVVFLITGYIFIRNKKNKHIG